MLRKIFRWLWPYPTTQEQDQRSQLDKELWARAFLNGLEEKNRRDKEFQQTLERGGK